MIQFIRWIDGIRDDSMEGMIDGAREGQHHQNRIELTNGIESS